MGITPCRVSLARETKVQVGIAAGSFLEGRGLVGGQGWQRQGRKEQAFQAECRGRDRNQHGLGRTERLA